MKIFSIISMISVCKVYLTFDQYVQFYVAGLSPKRWAQSGSNEPAISSEV